MSNISLQAKSALEVIDSIPAPEITLFASSDPVKRGRSAALAGARNGAAKNALADMIGDVDSCPVANIVMDMTSCTKDELIAALECRGEYPKMSLHDLAVSAYTSCENIIRYIASIELSK